MRKKTGKNRIYGAIIGDMVGSIYESAPVLKDKAYTFPLWKRSPLFHKDKVPNAGSRFMDDTVCGLAIAHALERLRLNIDKEPDEKECKDAFIDALKRVCHDYDYCGFGNAFHQWVMSEKNREPYNSYGNGSAMRVFPVGLFDCGLPYDHDHMGFQHDGGQVILFIFFYLMAFCLMAETV